MMGSSALWDFTIPGSKIAQSVTIRSCLATNTAEAAVDAAIAGVGMSRVLSYQSAQAVKEGKLDIVLARFEPEPIPVNLVRAEQAHQPFKMRAFLDFVVPRLRERITNIEK